jgi:hypothetical protein
MATGTIRFHLIEKITVQNELTELFMDEPLGRNTQRLPLRRDWRNHWNMPAASRPRSPRQEA